MRPITLDVVGAVTSAPIPLDFHRVPFSVSVGLSILSGAIVATLEYTLDDVFAVGYDPATGVWYPHADLTAKTANTMVTLNSPVTAIRVVNAGAGTVRARILQPWAYA